MKWMWLTLLGVLGPLLLVAAVGLALARPGLPLAAQNALDNYLAQQGSAPLRVEAAERTVHAQAFTAALIRASYGGSYYFSDLGRPAPFPPAELWCVTLAGEGAQRTVFVAQHEDMYVGVWLVHEPRSAGAAAAVCE